MKMLKNLYEYNFFPLRSDGNRDVFQNYFTKRNESIEYHLYFLYHLSADFSEIAEK